MSVKIRVSHGKLFLDVYWQGERKWVNLNLSLPADKVQAKETLRLAEIIRVKREQQLVAGEWDLQDLIAGKQGLIAYAEKLASTQESKNPLPKSLKYLKPYAGTIAIGEVTTAWIEGYRQYLLAQEELSDSTAAKYLSALKHVIQQALRDRLIIRDPTVGLKGIKVPDAETEYVTLDDINLLARTSLGGALGAEIKQAFLFGFFSGLRISDLKRLKWRNITRDPPSIEIRQQKTKAPLRMRLAASAWKIIDDKATHKGDDYVFPKLATTQSNTNQYLKAWAERAGLDKRIGWHCARRGFGTMALQAGGDLATVAKALGHKNIKHTQRYLKTDDKAVAHVIEALPEIDLEPKKAEILEMPNAAGGNA